MIKYSNRPLLINYTSLLLVQGGNFIFPLLVFPIIGRNIGVSEFGNILFCYMVALYFSIFVDYGFNFSAIRTLAKMEHQQSIGQLFYNITFAKLILAIPALLTLVLMTLLWEKFNQLSECMFISSLLILASMLSPYWLFQGRGATATGAMITLFSRLSTLLIFLYFPITTTSAALLLTIPSLLAALIMLFLAFKKYPIGMPTISWSATRSHLKEGRPIFVANSITMVYSASNTILLGFIADPIIAGLYGAAERLVRSGLAVIAPLCQAAYPIICNYDKKAQMAKRHQIIKLILALSLLFGTGAFLTVNVFSTQIITLLFGVNFIDAAPMLSVLSIMLLIIPPSMVLAQLYLLANSHDKILQRIYVFCSATHCVQIYFMIKFYNALGASYALILTELLATILIVSLSLKFFKNELQMNFAA